MGNCEQTKGLSVLAHGESVFAYYEDLRAHVLEGSEPTYQWRLPEWILDAGLWAKQVHEDVVREYMVFHDCGKPYCREVGQDGRVHFPNHALVSSDIWKGIGSEESAILMGMDMDIHLLKAEGMPEFAERAQAASLLIAGFCEIHSNAAMLGGIDSTSFKSKWKHIDRRGKQLVKMI